MVQSISWRYILITSSHLYLGLPSDYPPENQSEMPSLRTWQIKNYEAFITEKHLRMFRGEEIAIIKNSHHIN